MTMTKSKELYTRATKSIPGGVHSNSRDRLPHPLYFKQAKGAYITDVDNVTYIDLIMGNGAIIFGHDYEPFKEKMKEKLGNGLLTGVESELSIEAAEKFLELVPVEQVRFTNTGTEAMMHCISIARSYTGKNDVAVIEGAYNGWYDYVFVSSWPDLSKAGNIEAPKSLPGMGGLHPNAVQSTLVLPFNNIEATEKLIREHAHRLAAVILEPVMIDVGYIEPDVAYLKKLRELCSELNIILIFDELLTGFRISLGGCQAYYDIKPDLSTFGKAISNGYILAAVAGKREFLKESVSGGKTSFIGTYNGHQVSLAAAIAVFDLLKDGKVLQTLQERTERLIQSFAESAKKYGINAQMKGRGGHIHWYFTDKNIRNYRDAAYSNAQHYYTFAQEMNKQNILMSNKYLSHHKLSYSHDDEVLEKLSHAMDKALFAVAKSERG
jgi:glutamate-1-semialdehyde 2,1-aminomutase